MDFDEHDEKPIWDAFNALAQLADRHMPGFTASWCRWYLNQNDGQPLAEDNGNN